MEQLRKVPWPKCLLTDLVTYLIKDGPCIRVQTDSVSFTHTYTLLFTHTASSMRAVSSLINSHFLYLLSMWHFDPISVAEGTSQVQEQENVCKREKKAHTRKEVGRESDAL